MWNALVANLAYTKELIKINYNKNKIYCVRN